jgi:hypothetical protein
MVAEPFTSHTLLTLNVANYESPTGKKTHTHTHTNVEITFFELLSEFSKANESLLQN